MPCYRPIPAYRALEGGGVAFDSSKGYVDRPLELPCGKCPGCLEARAAMWSVRNFHELQCHDQAAFVTLTYGDEWLPPNESLNVRDWQLFAKRLRRKAGAFRFFMCGEYGSQMGRPHYHALVYGHSFESDRYFWRNSEKGSRLYRSPLLEECWPYGHVETADVTMGSIAYVSRYCTSKQVTKEHQRNGLTPEFCLMSRKPGIGLHWLERFKKDVFPSDELVVNGRRYAMPRYYDERLGEAERELLKAKRRKLVKPAEQTPDRLRVREEVHESRANVYGR